MTHMQLKICRVLSKSRPFQVLPAPYWPGELPGSLLQEEGRWTPALSAGPPPLSCRKYLEMVTLPRAPANVRLWQHQKARPQTERSGPGRLEAPTQPLPTAGTAALGAPESGPSCLEMETSSDTLPTGPLAGVRGLRQCAQGRARIPLPRPPTFSSVALSATKSSSARGTLTGDRSRDPWLLRAASPWRLSPRPRWESQGATTADLGRWEHSGSWLSRQTSWWGVRTAPSPADSPQERRSDPLASTAL